MDPNPESFEDLLDAIYKYGASPDIAYLSLDNALLYGLIGKTQYHVRRFMQRLHIPQPPIQFRQNPTLTAFAEGWQRGYAKGIAKGGAFVPYYPLKDPHNYIAPGEIDTSRVVGEAPADDSSPPSNGVNPAPGSTGD